MPAAPCMSGSMTTAASSSVCRSINRVISVAFSEPYWTVDGVSRTIEVYQRNTDPGSLSVSQYTSSTGGGAVQFGVPISETDIVNVGLRYEHTHLSLVADSPPAYILYVAEFGPPR